MGEWSYSRCSLHLAHNRLLRSFQQQSLSALSRFASILAEPSHNPSLTVRQHIPITDLRGPLRLSGPVAERPREVLMDSVPKPDPRADSVPVCPPSHRSFRFSRGKCVGG